MNKGLRRRRTVRARKLLGTAGLAVASLGAGCSATQQQGTDDRMVIGNPKAPAYDVPPTRSTDADFGNSVIMMQPVGNPKSPMYDGIGGTGAGGTGGFDGFIGGNPMINPMMVRKPPIADPPIARDASVADAQVTDGDEDAGN